MSESYAADSILVQRWEAGEDTAFAELFDRHRTALRNMVRMRIGGQLAARMDASDVIQESFLDARRRGQDYLRNPHVEFYVWLRGLTSDRLMKMQRMHLGAQRRSVKRELRLPNGSSMLLADQLLGNEGSPSAHARRRELRDQVRCALESLGSADRDVILMRHFERMSNSQVAQAMGIAASTATMRHGRALVRLRDALAEEISRGDLA